MIKHSPTFSINTHTHYTYTVYACIERECRSMVMAFYDDDDDVCMYEK